MSSPVVPVRTGITTTRTASNMWPFAVPPAPWTVGTPLGVSDTGRAVNYDPLSSAKAGHQQASQLAIIAKNGLGKSHFGKVVVAGLYAGHGVAPIAPADFKNEWSPLVTMLGGSTMRLTRAGGFNLVDPGEIIAVAVKSGADPELLDDLRARRNNLVEIVAGIINGGRVSYEVMMVINAGLDRLMPGSTIHHLPSTIGDVATVAGWLNIPAGMIGDAHREAYLLSVALSNHQIGKTLGTHSPEQVWSIENGLVVDTSSIPESEVDLSAAVAVACWTAAQSAVAFYRSFCGQSQQMFSLVFDEIWRATRNYKQLAELIGGLMRMDRHEGFVSILLTHSWADLQLDAKDNIANRISAIALGGLDPQERDVIRNSGALSSAEDELLARNAAGGVAPDGRPMGGTGRFLLRVPGRPAIHVKIGTSEALPSDTNQMLRPDQPDNDGGSGDDDDVSPELEVRRIHPERVAVAS